MWDSFVRLFAPETIRFGMIASALYMLPLRHRKRFPLRLSLCFAASFLIYPLFLSGENLLERLFTASDGNETGNGIRVVRLVVQSNARLLVCLLLLTLAFRFCCDLSFSNAYFGAILGYTTRDLVYTLFAAVMPTYIRRGEAFTELRYYLAEFLVASLMFTICYFHVARALPEYGEYQLPCVPLSAAMTFVLMMNRVLGVYARIGFAARQNQLYFKSQMFELFLVEALFHILVASLKKNNDAKLAAATEERLRIRQRQEYESFRKNVDAINHKCHDLKHLISALQFESNGQRKKDLLRDLEQEVMIYDAHMNTGSEALDALLERTWVRCQDLDVQWTCLADGKAVSNLDPVDLYVLLGNALDNALEALTEVTDHDRRILSVNIWSRGSFLSLRSKTTARSYRRSTTDFRLPRKRTPKITDTE